MTLSPITPGNTPRQVIPFGDRPIVDASGRPTPEFYQWCNRVSGGLTSSITNISTTITETNTISETVNNISVDVSGIEAEIATIDTTLGVLQGEIAAVQFEATSIPTPPPPAVPAAALVQQVAVPPPAPARWAGSADFVELEAGSNPTKISAMPQLDPRTFADIDGTELVPVAKGSANDSVSLANVYVLATDWIGLIANNPLDGTVSAAPLPVQFAGGLPFGGSNDSGGAFVANGGTGDGTGNGGGASLAAGNAGSDPAARGGALSMNDGSAAGNDQSFIFLPGGLPAGIGPGIVQIIASDAFSGTDNAGTPMQLQTGAGDGAGAGGDFSINTGSGANSGTITLQTGTATGTRGNIVLDAPLIVAPAGNDLNVQSIDNAAAATGNAFIYSGDASAATFVSGDAGVGSGNTGSATSGQAFVYTGDSTSGDTGAVNVGSGTATAGTSGIVTIVSGPGNATGAFFLQSGPAAAGNSGVVELQSGNATGGDSGNVILQTGTATGTRGNIVLDGLLVVLVGLPTMAPVTSGAIWRDAGAGNVLKQVP